MSIEICETGISVVEDESLFDLVADPSSAILHNPDEQETEEYLGRPFLSKETKPSFKVSLFNRARLKRNAKQKGADEAKMYQRGRELKQYKEDRESEDARIEDRSETVRGGELWPEEVHIEEERP